jgi:subtilisin-like proprotein convertase family protein
MFTRIIMLMLIVGLALPVATLTRPVEISSSPWGDFTVEAKGKRHKKAKKPKVKTVRQEVTRTFSSTGPIAIPAGAPNSDEGPADPYPATIEVDGFTKGKILDVNLILTQLTHDFPEDIDILLSSSDGRHALVMSDVGDNDDVVDINLTLDDEATAPLPEGERMTSGTFRPTNYSSFPDDFAPPAPVLTGSAALSAFDGGDPNGAWRLWVMDNKAGSVGDLAGWALEITAEVDLKEKVKHKKGNGR